MAWSNELTFKFIDLYHSEPAIWNPKHQLHKDKTVVSEAWERISEEMNVPVSELKKKKETLMAAFRLNHKKKIASMKSGDPGNIFTPIWTFYDPLAAFLADVYDYYKTNNNSSVNNTDDGSSSFSTFQEKWNPVIEVGIEELSNAENYTQPNPLKRRHSETTPVPEPADHLPHKYDTFLSTAITAVANVLSQQKTDDDDCDLFGKLLAMKLRKLSELERWEVMYEIDGLLIQKRIKTEPGRLDSSDYND